MPWLPSELSNVYFAIDDEQHNEQHVFGDKGNVFQGFIHEIFRDERDIGEYGVEYNTYHH